MLSGFTFAESGSPAVGTEAERHGISEQIDMPVVETKEYWKADISEDFDDSSVLVVLDKQTGGINKRHEERFFGSFAKEAIYDLSFINTANSREISKELSSAGELRKEDVRELKSLDADNFNQILQIKLAEKSKESVIDAIKQLEKIDGVLWAGPNHYEQPMAKPANWNGTRYPQQWGLHGANGIQAEAAWDITTGSHAVRVGVIDSGLDAHPDLVGNRVNEGGDFVNMANVNNNTPGALRADPSGHGTNVAGVIGANGNVTNGVAGVCLNVQLIPLQVSVLSSGSWVNDVAAVTRAINWAAANNIHVLNYSAGGTSDNVARRNAIENYNGLFVAAAGNYPQMGTSGNNDSQPIYPANYSNGYAFSNKVIFVGSVASNGSMSSFSHYGKIVLVFLHQAQAFIP